MFWIMTPGLYHSDSGYHAPIEGHDNHRYRWLVRGSGMLRLE